MRLFAAAALCAVLLSGCFWGSGNLYKGYRQNFGVYVAHSNVNAFCLSPKLRLAILAFESHFRRPIVLNSGFRDPFYNATVGGADQSYHTRCMAADFFIPGVPKSQLIAFAKRERLVGGLGCYPGRDFIHIDVRDRPRGWNRPVTFSGC